MYLGEASAVTVNSKGHVFVFSRGGSSSGPAFAETAAQLLEFTPDGKYIREIGKNLYAWSFAHGVKADPHDNIWAIDKGSDMVIKFRPDGRVDMVFGRKKEASDEATGPLKHPNPPLPAVDGQIPSTDRRRLRRAGQCLYQRRLHQFARRQDRQGRVLGEILGRSRHRAGPVQHGAWHRRRREGNIYVADRSNRRIQVFDGDGNFLRQ